MSNDFFDYKILLKQVDFNKEEYLKNSQKTKCRYLISGLISKNKLISVICIYFSLALTCGFFLFLKCGTGVIYFTIIGAIIALTYPFLSRIKLSELSVALAYGPALFGGVYYVMTGKYSAEAFLLSIPTTIMTIVLLYIHTIMDFYFDLNEGKRTIANCFDTQLESLIILKFLLVTSYLSVILLCILDILDWQVFLVYLTIPLANDLYKSLTDFSQNSANIPTKKWYHFPMEKLDFFKSKGEASFMIRMYQSRNLMIYFSILFTIAIIASLTI